MLWNQHPLNLHQSPSAIEANQFTRLENTAVESEVQVENQGGQVCPNAHFSLSGHVSHISKASLGRERPLLVSHPYPSACILPFYLSSPSGVNI